jgi:hypothetical protein
MGATKVGQAQSGASAVGDQRVWWLQPEPVIMRLGGACRCVMIVIDDTFVCLTLRNWITLHFYVP